MDNTFWQAFFINLVNAVIPVLVTTLPILVAAVFGLLVQYIRLLQTRISKEYPSEYQTLEKLCGSAVLIAEQMKLADKIKDKKAFAIDYVQKELDSLGIKMDVSKIETELEKAVYLEFNKQ